MVINMLSYENFPPLENFVKVLKRAPAAALLYVQIHHQKDAKNHLTIAKEDVRNHFNTSATLFRNQCLYLAEDGLLYLSETSKYYILDLIK